MEKREQQSDDSAGLTLPGVPTVPCSSTARAPAGTTQRTCSRAGWAVGDGERGAAPAEAARGEHGLRGCRAGQHVPGVPGVPALGRSPCPPAPSCARGGASPRPASTSLPEPSLPLAGCSILLPAAPAQRPAVLRGRRGCRGTERLPGPAGAAGPGSLVPPGLSHSPGHQDPPGQHLCTGAVPVPGTPGRALTVGHTSLCSPLLPCPGWLPSGTARCQVSVPGGLS